MILKYLYENNYGNVMDRAFSKSIDINYTLDTNKFLNFFGELRRVRFLVSDEDLLIKDLVLYLSPLGTIYIDTQGFIDDNDLDSLKTIYDEAFNILNEGYLDDGISNVRIETKTFHQNLDIDKYKVENSLINRSSMNILRNFLYSSKIHKIKFKLIPYISKEVDISLTLLMKNNIDVAVYTDSKFIKEKITNVQFYVIIKQLYVRLTKSHEGDLSNFGGIII